MKLRITIDDKTYEVDVEVAETDHASLPPAYPIGSARLAGSAASSAAHPAVGTAAGSPPVPPANESKVCRSPVSGVVVKVLAVAGNSIEAGDSLLLLEAMKMETNITAPLAGVIAAVNFKAGDHVQTGDVLVEFK
ncbi:MAG: biotin/lipoyl-containing protein [Azoarcus sp.]|nr:biotin/lipoyl-containing protein [Azoarcus sp.]